MGAIIWLMLYIVTFRHLQASVIQKSHPLFFRLFIIHIFNIFIGQIERFFNRFSADRSPGTQQTTDNSCSPIRQKDND